MGARGTTTMDAAIPVCIVGTRRIRHLWFFNAVVQHRRRGDSGVRGRHLLEKAIADVRGVNLGKLAVLGRGFLSNLSEIYVVIIMYKTDVCQSGSRIISA